MVEWRRKIVTKKRMEKKNERERDKRNGSYVVVVAFISLLYSYPSNGTYIKHLPSYKKEKFKGDIYVHTLKESFHRAPNFF